MSSLISFIRSMFSSNTETPKSNLILTKDGWVVLKPCSDEVLQISIENNLCDIGSIMNPLHPLNMKSVAGNVGMMCLTY
jgi:hypothetical protein